MIVNLPRLVCDGCGGHHPARDLSRAKVRAAAKRDGWTRIPRPGGPRQRGADLCPRCKPWGAR